MGMSDFYGATDEPESIETIHRALELGVNLLDTADVYGPFTTRSWSAGPSRDRRDDVVLATKFGIVADGRSHRRGSQRHARVRAQRVRRSLHRLGVDHIDLYYQHRVDPNVPIEDTVGAMAELVAGGQGALPRTVGGGPDTIRRATRASDRRAADRVVAVDPRPRGGDRADVPRARHRHRRLQPAGPRVPHRAVHQPRRLRRRRLARDQPRFQGENFAKNLELVEQVRRWPTTRRARPAQLALAWVHAQGDDVFRSRAPSAHVPRGERRRDEVSLSDDELATLDAIVPAPAIATRT